MWPKITRTSKQTGRKREEDQGDTEKRTSRLVEAMNWLIRADKKRRRVRKYCFSFKRIGWGTAWSSCRSILRAPALIFSLPFSFTHTPMPFLLYRFPACSLESGATFHSSSNERRSRSNFLCAFVFTLSASFPHFLSSTGFSKGHI
jgi:hypothetical protein